MQIGAWAFWHYRVLGKFWWFWAIFCLFLVIHILHFLGGFEGNFKLFGILDNIRKDFFQKYIIYRWLK